MIFSVCPEGYYGDHCMKPCECPNENFVCHPADGCVCRQGYAGDDCDQQLLLTLTKNGDVEQSNAGSITAGVIVALILVSIIILLVLYYKRRVKDLKTEIQVVQYVADPSSQPGMIELLIHNT